MSEGGDYCHSLAHCSLLNLIFLYIVYVIFLCYSAQFSSEGQSASFLRSSHDCIVESIADMDSEEIWLKFPTIVNSCSRLRLLDLKGYSNLDETKYHVQRKDKKAPCTIISLGIGRDVGVELQLKKDEPGCQFYGADPVEETNRRIYGKFGTFFHTAVGAHNGTHKAAVLDTKSWDYKNQSVHYTHFYDFVQKDVRHTLIDQLMIDIEYAEYALFPHILIANRPEDMAFCQMNIEIHMGAAKKRKEFATFMHQLLDEGEFVPLRAATMLGHIRLYFLNFSNRICRERYIDGYKEE